jgi:hypothetical protein
MLWYLRKDGSISESMSLGRHGPPYGYAITRREIIQALFKAFPKAKKDINSPDTYLA